ncbi:DUF882 domain-containing protein [Roseibium aggregatum]|uniref:DUF882 domain-containing protein n=1 Tax=Roseibium aggregatum TaxID=187304 RepID=UPI003AF34B7E
MGALAILSACLTSAQAETRTLKLYNTHTKERVSVTFKKNGRYLPQGLREANRFLRDWRRNEIIKMDPELLDLVWEVYQKVGARDHIHVVSSYRSPATNNMLRKRSSGVAKNSQHTLGKAMDFYIPGVNLAKLRATGLKKQIGGVGYYPRSGSPFVHMDTGRVRHWPRMSRSQLAKVFPDGKTLHIPSDGKPLSGYKIALAQAKAGKLGKSSSRPTLVASNDRSPSTRNQSLTNPSKTTTASAQERPSSGGNLFASLFGGGRDKPAGDKAPPGAIGAGAQASPAADTVSPVIENPPVPARKFVEPAPQETPAPEAAPIVVASAAPSSKPQAAAAAPSVSEAPPAPNTLDAQRAALEAGQPALTDATLDSRFQVARAPSHKPDQRLSEAAQDAAQALGQTGSIPVPASAPAEDPVAAIAAATASATPSPTPAPRPAATLAYASATATPPVPALSRSLRAPAAEPQPAGRQGQLTRDEQAKPTVSGRIPKDRIVDPLAGFASLPDKSAPALLSGSRTTRHQSFAWLSHPNQRELKNVMKPGNRFVAASFENRPYGSLRTDRFDGPAVVVLPVRFAR